MRVAIEGASSLDASQRVFFDVSYTRTQQGAVGITRTVRRLLDHLRDSATAGAECIPIVFHTGGFRMAPPQSSPSAGGGVEPGADAMSARLLRRLVSSSLRRRITAAMPVGVLLAAWRLYSHFTFDALAKGLVPVQFRPGDLLLLCDASWNYRVWLATRAAQEAGARVVVMVHDLIPLRHPEYGAPLLTATFGRWLAEMVRGADAIVCNSVATMEDLNAYGEERGWILPPVSHFRLGSDIAPRAVATAVRAGLLQMTDGAAPCFAAVGSIESRKNYGVVLAAFERLWNEGKDCRLVLIGRRTAECSDFADQLASHPEKGRRFLPVFDASDSEVDHVYSACCALVFASLAEGFGLPLVEARSRGALVIASDIPVFRELADEGTVLFARRSPQALAERLLEAGRCQGRGRIAPMPAFTWQQSARQLLSVTRAMLAAR